MIAFVPIEDRMEEARRERSVLEIPPHPASIKTARLFAAAIARHFACPEDEIEDVRLAISEAVTSAVRAQQDAGVTQQIKVSGELDGDTLRFEVSHAGPPPDSVPEGVTPPGGLYEGSLGLALVESLFEDSTIARTSDGGTFVTFSIALVGALHAEPAE